MSAPTRKYHSKTWKYFDVLNRSEKIAKCKICQRVLSYRSTVTNLVKHIRTQHNILLRQDSIDKSENDGDSTPSLSENEDEECNENDDEFENNKDVKTLEEITTKNEVETVCLLCQEAFPEKDSTAMVDHMFKVHNISQIKIVDGSLHLEQADDKAVKPSKPRRSYSWDYFTKKNKVAKTAVCNLCSLELSYRSTVSNLNKHLKRKHQIDLRTARNQYITDTPEKSTYEARAAIWSFFNYVNDEKTVCACIHCNKEFDVVGGLKCMKRHLLMNHPEALLHHKTTSDPLFITTIDDDDDDNGNNEDNVHEEYLNFEDLDNLDNVKRGYERRSSSEQKSSFEGRPKRPRVYRSPVLFQNNVPSQSKIPDTLEHFSNYAISLLQELPDKISKKLQMNFIKQIIEAQIACAEIENTRKEPVTKNISTVTRTVPNSDVSVNSVTVQDSVFVGEAVTSCSTNIVDSNGTVNVGNGIIIQPIVTTP